MNISECFYSIQAEGISSGMPAVFVRMQGCNLMCGGTGGSLMKEGKATWWCDSETVWKSGTSYSNDDLLKKFNSLGELENIRKGTTRIVWTGGEPTLPNHVRDIKEFLNYWQKLGRSDHIYNEIETNGTQVVPSEFYTDPLYIRQINCSPKLSNSGIPIEKRINKDAIAQIKQHPNSWFKFVIGEEWDIDEIYSDFIQSCGISEESIILMPGCDKREDLPERTRFVWEMSQRYHLRMCSRLQVLAFDRLTGI